MKGSIPKSADTPGIVALTFKGEVFLKITCACGGEFHTRLALPLGLDKVSDADEVYKIALQDGFGCKQCLVVSDARDNLYEGDEKLPASYWENLQDPQYHPGVKGGAVEHFSIIDYPVKGGKKDASKENLADTKVTA